MKKILKIAAAIILAVVVFAGGYVGYLFADYSRLEDNLPLSVADGAQGVLEAGTPHTAVTWNVGFGAYSDDFSFFMDGGKESRAYSKAAVLENTAAAIDTLHNLNADLMLIQEVDTDSTRSHHVNQSTMFCEAFPDFDSVFAQNYDSSYLPAPILKPHGASESGMLTLANVEITSALRRSLPVDTGIMKFFDLDRCYSISEIPVSDGKTLSLFALHLSAYASDGSIVDAQMAMLANDIQKALDRGDYVIAAGDFNRDLMGNSAEIFGVSGELFLWALPIDMTLLPEEMILVSSLDPAAPVPSCRNTDIPYEPGVSFVLTVDGFIVSPNVQVLDCRVSDEAFAVSDHNPVVLEFVLGDHQ